MRKYLPLLIVLSILFFACQGKKNYSIIGNWQGTGDDGTAQILEFQNNGNVRWILKNTMFSDTFNVKYKTDNGFEPMHMDFYDFQKGFLKDKSLYFVYDFEDINTLKLDAGAGTSDTVRPAGFTESTVVYKRLD